MKSKAKEIFLSLGVVGLILWGIGFACEVVNSGHYKMPNSAMEPTIMAGETFLADMTAYDSANPERWDLVVFRSPQDATKTWVFRVVGMPGETISFSEGGLLINDNLANIPNGLDVTYHSRTDEENSSFVVPSTNYYVLGDNPAKANDSRFWGAVSQSAIIGKVDVE